MLIPDKGLTIEYEDTVWSVSHWNSPFILDADLSLVIPQLIEVGLSQTRKL